MSSKEASSEIVVNFVMFWVNSFSNDIIGFLCEHFGVHAKAHISQTQEKLHKYVFNGWWEELLGAVELLD